LNILGRIDTSPYSKDVVIATKMLVLRFLGKKSQIEKIIKDYGQKDPGPSFTYQRAAYYDSIGKFDQAINDLAFAFAKDPTLKILSHNFSKKLITDKRFKLLMVDHAKKT
jgi:lipoprotein NlpI